MLYIMVEARHLQAAQGLWFEPRLRLWEPSQRPSYDSRRVHGRICDRHKGEARFRYGHIML